MSQGTVLGPTFFCIFVDNMLTILPDNVGIRNADDTVAIVKSDISTIQLKIAVTAIKKIQMWLDLNCSLSLSLSLYEY